MAWNLIITQIKILSWDLKNRFVIKKQLQNSWAEKKWKDGERGGWKGFMTDNERWVQYGCQIAVDV